MKNKKPTTARSWPAPESATRVVVDANGNSPLPPRRSSPASTQPSEPRPRRGELIVAAGLVGILAAVGSAFVKAVDLPSTSRVAVGGIGVVLVLIGVLARRRPTTSTAAQPVIAADIPPVVESPPTIEALPTIEPARPVVPRQVRVRPAAVDLPSLTGQLSEVLAELRHEYGMAYRTRTWIEEMLPAYGAELDDPVLARALLAVAALDAGGIRADVSGLVGSHGNDEIIATGKVVLAALHEVRAACDGSGTRSDVPVRASDPSRWPAPVS
jgi:hypothetical protein